MGWLTQSITDNLKTCQQQVVTAVDTVARCAWMPCADVGVPFPMHRAKEVCCCCVDDGGVVVAFLLTLLSTLLLSLWLV